MSKTLFNNVSTVQEQFLKILDDVFNNGDTVIIERNGTPCAKLVPVSKQDLSDSEIIIHDQIYYDSRALFSKVFEFSGEAIMITDQQDSILLVNKAFTKLTGYEHDEVIGRNPRFLDAGKLDDSFYDQMWAVVHRDGHWKGEVWNRKKNGEVFVEWLAISAVRDKNNRIEHFISIFSDITEQKAKEEHIRRLAHHDFLTGLPNRILLQDRFIHAKTYLKRHKSKKYCVAILFMDLDGFKKINDIHGHNAGDNILKEVANRIGHCVRETDAVSRHGGDEFIVLLEEVTNRDSVTKLADKIITVLKQPFKIDEDTTVKISVSIGISFYPENGIELEQLITNADQAMYEVKHSGKGLWAISKQVRES